MQEAMGRMGSNQFQLQDDIHREVAENIDHLVNLGLAEYTGDVPRTARLTQSGQDATASLP